MAAKPLTIQEIRDYSSERLTAMKNAGIKFVSVLGCNYQPDECEALLAIKGVKMEIQYATPLPLSGCDKNCKCIYLAEQ